MAHSRVALLNTRRPFTRSKFSCQGKYIMSWHEWLASSRWYRCHYSSDLGCHLSDGELHQVAGATEANSDFKELTFLWLCKQSGQPTEVQIAQWIMRTLHFMTSCRIAVGKYLWLAWLGQHDQCLMVCHQYLGLLLCPFISMLMGEWCGVENIDRYPSPCLFYWYYVNYGVTVLLYNWLGSQKMTHPVNQIGFVCADICDISP